MIRLLDIEFHKLWHNKMSRVLILTSFILPFTVFVLSSIKIDFFGYFTLDLAKTGIFNFPIIWHIITFFAALFKFFFAFVAVSMVSNEYNFRTLKQNLIDGLSKRELILSKFGFIFIYSLISTCFVFLITLIIGMIHSSYNESFVIFLESEYILAYFLKLLCFFSLCFFLAVLIKRSAFALGFLFILYILELIVYSFIRWKWGNEKTADLIMQFAPFTSIYNLINQPLQRIVMVSQDVKVNLMYDYAVHWYEIVISVFWTTIFMFLSYKLLEKRDL